MLLMTYDSPPIVRSNPKYLRPMTRQGMRLFHALVGVLLWALPKGFWAQSQACENAIDVCGSTDTLVTTGAPLDLPGAEFLFGFDANYAQVVTFHTTYFRTFDDEADTLTVEFEDIECGGGAMVAQVFEQTTTDACDVGGYAARSTVWALNGDTTRVTEALKENADYVLLVGAPNSTCATNIRLTGAPVSIEVCCPVTIDVGESARVEVLGGDGSLGMDWSPSESVVVLNNQEAELSPDSTQTYTVTAYLGLCQLTDDITIKVIDIAPPEAFTPNDDTVNDTWEIPELKNYPYATLDVYDRWGQPVFQSVSYPVPWNGEHRGRPVPVGTYYYVIHRNVPNVQLDPITGYVAVVR